MARALRALANAQRLRLVRLLTRPRYGEELAQEMGMTRQAVLKHVKVLQDAGFLRVLCGRRDTGPVNEFQVVPNRLFALGTAVTEMGNLTPEGGPDIRHDDRTIFIDAKGEEIETGVQDQATRDPHLLVLSGPNQGNRVELSIGDRWTIGRESDRDIVAVHDPYVSSYHCEIRRQGTGFALVDAESRNGTRLNCRLIPRGSTVPLRPGDVIGVGHSNLVFQRESIE